MDDNAYLARLARQQYLKPDEEKRLIFAWQNDKDIEARNKVVLAYMPMITRIARKLARRLDAKADVVHEGCVGVIRAMDSYEEGVAAFCTLASLFARQDIIKYMFRNRSVLKMGNTNLTKIIYFNLDKQKRRLGISGDSLSQTEAEALAKAFGCKAERVAEIANALSPQTSVQDTVGPDEEEGRDLSELLASDDPNPEDIVQERDVLKRRREIIASAVERMKPQQRDMFKRYYMTDEPVLIREIAESYGVSRQAVNQTCRSGLKRVQHYVSLHPE